MSRVAATAIAWIVFAVAAVPVARASCTTESVEMPVVIMGSRAIAAVGINGTTIPLVVDSGAAQSVLTLDAALKLNLKTSGRRILYIQGIGGEVPTYMVRANKLRLFKSEINDIDFMVMGGSPSAGTMGLMGRNILSLADTEYDLAHSVIRLHFPNDECTQANMAYWAGVSPVSEIELADEWFNKKPAIRARAKLNGKEISAVFDTGATTLVSKGAAHRAGIADAALTEAGTTTGFGPTRVPLFTASFDRFELGGETIHNNRLRVGDFEMADVDMLLGIDFFLSHRIYVSKKRSRMFFTYNGGPVFSMDLDKSDAIARGVETSAELLSRRALVSAARDDHANALTDLDAACALEPKSAALLVQRGGVHAAMSHWNEALADYDRALELEPANVDAHFGRAKARFGAQDRAGANADLDLLDRTIAPEASIRLTMAHVYLEFDQPANAVLQATRWLDTHWSDRMRGMALNNRCWSRARLGVDLDQALTDCDDAIYENPEDAYAFDSRAWVYLRLGKDKRAVSDFDRSLELSPDRAWSLYGRSLAKRRLGDATQGDADLVAARKSDADIDQKIAKAGLLAP